MFPGKDGREMSFTMVEQARLRLHRSDWRSRGRFRLCLRKRRSAADVIFLDLEDAVAPDDKPQARHNVIAALNELDRAARP